MVCAPLNREKKMAANGKSVENPVFDPCLSSFPHFFGHSFSLIFAHFFSPFQARKGSVPAQRNGITNLTSSPTTRIRWKIIRRWGLSDPTEIPPQYPCRTVFPVVSQTIAATPPLLSLKMAYRNQKTGLTRGVSQLASEAYRATGGRRTK